MKAEKKVAVVTGSYKGIGFEIARQLARVNDIQVILSSRDKAKGLNACEKLVREGLEVDYLPLDVTDEQSVENFVKALREKYARADILVNNAGVNPTGEIEESSILTAKTDTILSTFLVNAVGPLKMCQALIPLMKERNFGRIVNVSTEMASLKHMVDDSYPNAPSYRLSKVALNGLACLFAKELKCSNILINNYSPGWVKTDMGGPNAPLSPEEAAKTAVYLATLPNGGVQGGFFAEIGEFGEPRALNW